MKYISEKTYDAIFWIGIGIKGAISVGELALGTLLLFFDYGALIKFATFFTGDELSETPRDAFWSYVAHGLSGFTNTPQGVWAFIFLSHGIIKTFLLIGIWKEVRWAYPASAIVFGLFAMYQVYQYIYTPSLLLITITVFDVVLIGLIMHEYGRQNSSVFCR